MTMPALAAPLGTVQARHPVCSGEEAAVRLRRRAHPPTDDAARIEYVSRKALEYLQRHPDVTLRYARRQARLRWRRVQKALAEVG